MNCEGAWVPVGGNEADRLLRDLNVRGGDRLCQVEDGNRIERGVRNEQILAIRGLRQRRRITAGIFLPGCGCGEEACDFGRRRGNSGHQIRVGESDVQRFLVRSQQHCGGMRTGSKGVFRLIQLDPAGDFAARQIKLRHLRCIPQAAPGAAAVARCHTGIWKRRRHQIAGAEIEGLQHFSGGGVEEHNVVRKIVRDQEFVSVSVGNHRYSGRIWNRHMGRCLQTNRQLLSRRQRLQRDWNEPFRRDFAFCEAVDRDAVSRVASFRSRRIGQRTDRRVQMLAVRTERQPEEVALVRLVAQARVWILGDLVALEIEHRDRLMRQRFLRAIAVVQQRGVAAVRTQHHRRGKAVGAANASWRWNGQHLAGRQHDGRTISGGRLCKNSRGTQQNKNRKTEDGTNHGASAPRMVWKRWR